MIKIEIDTKLLKITSDILRVILDVCFNSPDVIFMVWFMVWVFIREFFPFY